MMSIAAVKAMWQLVVTPSFWEKTTHGLHSDAEPTDGGESGDGADGGDESPRRSLVAS